MENENVNLNQPAAPYSGQSMGGQQPLPNATGVLVMGIISIAACWCYGIPGIVLGIISLILGGKAKKMYNANPSQYTLSSYKSMKAGYTCAIIGLSLSAVYLVFIIVYLLVIGAALSTAFSSMPWDSFNY
jgi:hypothetical protein